MSTLREALRRSFWLPSAIAMAVAVVLGYVVPELDEEVSIGLGLIGVSDADTARSILSTIATTTVSVAGVAFSITVVALQLSSQILTPRVLRTFRGDRLAQYTLAALIGTFVYSLLALSRLTSGEEAAVPELSVLLGVVLALGAIVAFVAFIGHIVVALQPATVVRLVAADGHKAVHNRHPRQIGAAPEDPEAAERRVRERRGSQRFEPVRSPRAGFLARVSPDDLIEKTRACDGMVVQRVPVGDFVVTGQTLAEMWAEQPQTAAREVQVAFRIGDQRTIDQDIAFPVRQLVDIALRGLSPSLNDATTAENAMDSVADTLVRFCREDSLSDIRVDHEGEPRFVAAAPNLDDLVRLGFEQPRGLIDDMPVFAARMVLLLEEIDRAARENGCRRAELQRQLRLHREIAERLPA